MKTFAIPKKSVQTELHVEKLPILDNGYFDTLVAIGYAALADAYYAGDSPLIEKTPLGFTVSHATVVRDRANLGWLRYSLAASWKSEKQFENGDIVKKDPVWDGEDIIHHEGAVVDTSTESTIIIEMGGKPQQVQAPLRELYGVINKLGKPTWFNACIHTCRKKGIELLTNQFSEKVSVNSIVLPQSSKGAMSSNSFSIANGGMPSKFVKQWGREICLAVAGIIAGSRGSMKNGFALPVPRNISFDFLQQLVDRNRKRIVPKDFFFPYNNYLYYLKLLITYGEIGKHRLSAVCGAKFIELGTQSSPAGVWNLAIPEYQFSYTSVENLTILLTKWRSAVKPKETSDPNVNRIDVERLMRGFEEGDIVSFTEGYLSYIETAGLESSKYLHFLNQNQFFEIMANNSTKYQELVETLRGPVVEPFIELIRQDTYELAIKKDGEKAEQPDYQLIRKLREVQNHEDFITALCEISIKRSIDKMASANTQTNERKQHNLPTQQAIAKLIELSENSKYSPKLVAQLLLALSLSEKINQNKKHFS